MGEEIPIIIERPKVLASFPEALTAKQQEAQAEIEARINREDTDDPAHRMPCTVGNRMPRIYVHLPMDRGGFVDVIEEALRYSIGVGLQHSVILVPEEQPDNPSDERHLLGEILNSFHPAVYKLLGIDSEDWITVRRGAYIFVDDHNYVCSGNSRLHTQAETHTHARWFPVSFLLMVRLDRRINKAMTDSIVHESKARQVMQACPHVGFETALKFVKGQLRDDDMFKELTSEDHDKAGAAVRGHDPNAIFSRTDEEEERQN